MIVKIIDKKKFTKEEINENIKDFIIYITSFCIGIRIIIYLFIEIQIFLVDIKRLSKNVSIESSYFVVIFLKQF